MGESHFRLVQAAKLSRAEAVDRLNEAARRFGVRLAAGSAKELGLATFEKWLNPKEAEYVPSVRALNLFCHVFGSVGHHGKAIRVMVRIRQNPSRATTPVRGRGERQSAPRPGPRPRAWGLGRDRV